MSKINCLCAFCVLWLSIVFAEQVCCQKVKNVPSSEFLNYYYFLFFFFFFSVFFQCLESVVFNGCRLSFVSSLLFLCLIVFNVISARFWFYQCWAYRKEFSICSAQVSNYMLNKKNRFISVASDFLKYFWKKGKNTDDAPEV